MIAYQAGNIGTELLFEIKNQAGVIVDISAGAGVVEREILMRYVGGDLRRGTLTVKTDGTNGQCFYNTLSGDLQAGTMTVQAKIVWNTGKTLRTNRFPLPVQGNLDDPVS